MAAKNAIITVHTSTYFLANCSVIHIKCKVKAGNSEWRVIRNTQYSAAGSVVAVGNG